MLRPYLKVTIGGTDVTSRFSPLLKSVKVTKKAGKSAHSASITLADPDGATIMPSDGDTIEIELGQSIADAGPVFRGTVNDVSSKGSTSGRTLEITASSADQKGKAKAPLRKSKDNATFKTVAEEWGAKAGLTVKVAGDLASINREYWSIDGESFMSWGQSIARQLGATFQIIGKEAFFTPRNEGVSVSGKPLPTVTAAWGVNLLSWEIKPTSGRPQFSKTKARYYDKAEAKYKEIEVEIPEQGGAPVLEDHRLYPDEAQAKKSAESSSKESKREKGSGTVTIVGDHSVEPEAKMVLHGARPGIDNTYLADEVTHDLDEKGFQTVVKVKLPDPKGGKDTRKPATSAAS